METYFESRELHSVMPFTRLRAGMYARPAGCLPACVPPRAHGEWSAGLLIRRR